MVLVIFYFIVSEVLNKCCSILFVVNGNKMVKNGTTKKLWKRLISPITFPYTHSIFFAEKKEKKSVKISCRCF